MALLFRGIAPPDRAVDLDEQPLRLAVGEAVRDVVEEQVRG